MQVRRSSEVYASWDGARELTLSEASGFDPDDSLAQLIFHEICHSLVAGPIGRKKPDFGLDNTSDRDLVFEHACHRLQAALSTPFGLRAFFAVTTEWRPYWDALPKDPLAYSEDPAVPIAKRAFLEAQTSPFNEVLNEALSDTATIAALARKAAPEDSLWALTRAQHPSGFLAHADASKRCESCAWSRARGTKLRCLQAQRAGKTSLLLAADQAGCELWEPRLTEDSCKTCGACCREGFDRVELKRGDRLRKVRPDLISEDRWGVFVPRPDGRCLPLVGNGEEFPYRCSVYADRPSSCADFEIGSSACLVARRRVRLSP